MTKYLKELCEINGTSGNESEVKEYILGKIDKKVDSIKVDPLGNLIAIKNGKKNGAKTLLLVAHMDEVGLMVTGFEDDGRISVLPVGGVDPRVLPGKRVKIGKKNLDGIIGYKAVHLQKDDYKKNPDWNDIKVEIGAKDKKEAGEKVSLGEYVHFYSPFEEYENRYVSKAFDDRAGCAVLLECIDRVEAEYFNIAFAFVVQEEIGLRGSGAVLKYVKADAALVIEGTTAGDNPELSEARWSTHLGRGPAISYLQSGYVLDYRLVESITETAAEAGIPYQMKGRTVGGTDATRLAKSFYGVPGAVINLPSRYIHSPVSVVAKDDYENLVKLALEILKNKRYLKAVEVRK